MNQIGSVYNLTVSVYSLGPTVWLAIHGWRCGRLDHTRVLSMCGENKVDDNDQDAEEKTKYGELKFGCGYNKYRCALTSGVWCQVLFTESRRKPF